MKQPGFHGSRMSHFECCELTLKPPTGASTSCDLKKWEKIGAILSAEQLNVWRLFWATPAILNFFDSDTITVTRDPWDQSRSPKRSGHPIWEPKCSQSGDKKKSSSTRVVLVVVMSFHLDWPSSLQITCGLQLGGAVWAFFWDDLELVVFFDASWIGKELEEHDPLIWALEHVSETPSEMSPVWVAKHVFFAWRKTWFLEDIILCCEASPLVDRIPVRQRWL